MNELERGSCVVSLETPERHMGTRALSVSLEVEEQDRVPSCAEKAGTAGHAETVRPNSVHQDYGGTARLTEDEPAAKLAARIASKDYGFSREVAGWWTDGGRCGSSEERREVEDTCPKNNRCHAEKSGEALHLVIAAS